jgi:hypothetical protein
MLVLHLLLALQDLDKENNKEKDTWKGNNIVFIEGTSCVYKSTNMKELERINCNVQRVSLDWDLGLKYPLTFQDSSAKFLIGLSIQNKIQEIIEKINMRQCKQF